MTTVKLLDRLFDIYEAVALAWTESGRFVKLRMVAVVALVISASVSSALGPVALKLIVDRFTHVTNDTSVSTYVFVGMYVMSQWMARAISALWALIYANAERRMYRTISERLFAHVMHLPMRFHLERQTGAISQTLENGLQGYSLILHHFVFTFLPVASQLATTMLVLSQTGHPMFVGLFCGALASYAVTLAYTTATFAETAEKASAAHIDANAAMTDAILNYETVKFFTAESTLQERVGRALSRTEAHWVNLFRKISLNEFAFGTIFAAFFGGTVLYGAHEVLAGQMSVGAFVLVNSYLLQVVGPVAMLSYALPEVSKGVGMLKRLLVLLREPPELMLTAPREPCVGHGMLEFDNVRAAYRPERSALTGVSFKIPAGKTLGIVGASGSGKSTIVRLLVRLCDPTSGRIYLDGVPITEISLAELRRCIAVVPQDTILFNDTIGYNIGFGKPNSTREEIEASAKLAHLHDFIMSLPDKYDTRVGERGVKLSGGEKQRVSIARAAIKHPRIYVFDEATSSLDSRTEREILRNLRELSRFSTTLIIAHRLSTVAHADEIVVLDRGLVVERGTHSSLLGKVGHYTALWEAQQDKAV